MPKEPDLSTYPVMTKWFSPRLLVWAAYRDMAARIFGEYADRRTTQHLADPIPSGDDLRRGFVFRYDYATGAGDKPFWVDFVADLGDGFEFDLLDCLSRGRRQALRQGPRERRDCRHQGPAPRPGAAARAPAPFRRRPDLPLADAGSLRSAHFQAVRSGATRAAGGSRWQRAASQPPRLRHPRQSRLVRRPQRLRRPVLPRPRQQVFASGAPFWRLSNLPAPQLLRNQAAAQLVDLGCRYPADQCARTRASSTISRRSPIAWRRATSSFS